MFIEAYEVVKKSNEVDCTDEEQIKQFFIDNLKHIMPDEV